MVRQTIDNKYNKQSTEISLGWFWLLGYNWWEMNEGVWLNCFFFSSFYNKYSNCYSEQQANFIWGISCLFLPLLTDNVCCYVVIYCFDLFFIVVVNPVVCLLTLLVFIPLSTFTHITWITTISQGQSLFLSKTLTWRWVRFLQF